MRDGEPTVLHLLAYPLRRRAHPACHRVITGLAACFRTVAATGDHPGYFDEGEVLPDADDPGAAGIDVHAVPEFMRRAHFPPELAVELERRHGRIDAVVAHQGPAIRRALPLARALSAPILSIFHGADADAELFTVEHGPVYQRLRQAPAAFFLAVSRNLVARLLTFGTPPERTFLHHLGVDLDRHPLRADVPTNGRLRIVMGGRFRPQKGQALGIRAFAALARRHPNVSLHHFGAGIKPEERELRTRLVALVGALELSHAVHFHGDQPEEVWRAEVARADIVLHPSVHAVENDRIEGLPNVVLEAMASGVPVVATRQAGLPDAVVHERTGLLVDEPDVDALAAALARLATNAELRRSFGLAGRRRVEREFDAARQNVRLAARVREMCDAYRRLGPRGRESGWAAAVPENEATGA